MGSKYPRSVRGCLPLWVLTVETAFILLFFFFTSYDDTSTDQETLMGTYRVFQDVTTMAALGLGFLNASLWRHGWSGVAFNLFLLALGAQWAVLLDGFLNQSIRQKTILHLPRIQKATVSALSVLISAGAVLGKANLVQLVLMALVEVTAFSTMRMLGLTVLGVDDHSSMMSIHVFAAYFGLAVSWCLSRPLPKAAEEKEQTATSPSLFAMLGTRFLWMFWPSFNGMLFVQVERMKAVSNTYYALAVSTVTATSVSALAHPQGKINMTHIHNAVLAGGVAVGATCHMIHSPWFSMALGLVAALISIGGAKCLPVCLNRVLGIHDSCGVHYTFGLPGLLGGVAYIVLMVTHSIWSGKNRIFYQVLVDTGALSLAMAMGLLSGLLAGLLLSLKVWKAPPVAKYFDDQAFWEFPHLAVGF
ncbi:blood group Rh(CE) polypeptide [Tupaia chinensis]|uniref:blood group Rh(CE) polypeptide n=1 Tax=Tupaia chinensis TaxID=246437 RepID=UPI0003C900DC|nr:blood group Rh(CE) polypeptide [Tupaia chinensis]